MQHFYQMWVQPKLAPYLAQLRGMLGAQGVAPLAAAKDHAE